MQNEKKYGSLGDNLVDWRDAEAFSSWPTGREKVDARNSLRGKVESSARGIKEVSGVDVGPDRACRCVAPWLAIGPPAAGP